MAVVHKIAIAVLGASLMAGCASTSTVDATKTVTVTSHQSSLPNMMVSMAGYPGLLADNGYSQTLDAAVNAGSLAKLLPGDVGISSMTAGGLGFALTALKGTYPVENGFALFVLQPIDSASDINKPGFVSAALKSNLSIRKPEKDDEPALANIINKANLNTIKCDVYSSFMNEAGFTHKCQIDTIPWPEHVKVVGVYEGSEFAGVMPSVQKGKYALIFIRSSGQIVGKPSAENVFMYKDKALINSIAVLPFIQANSEGKHLVYLNGKATLL